MRSVERSEPADRELVQPSSCEHGRMGRQRPRRGRPGGIESDPALGELDQGRAGGPVVAVQAQVARRDGVQHDQEDIRRPRRRQGPRILARLLDPVADPERCPQDRHDRHGHRETDQDESPEAAAIALDKRNEPRGQPQRHDQPGQTCRSGERRPGHRARASVAHRPRANSQRPRRGQTRIDATPEQSQRQENAEVRERDQPDEVAAHLVEMIGIEQLLAEHDRAHFKQARDQPAPGRQEQQRDQPGSLEAGSTSRPFRPP